MTQLLVNTKEKFYTGSRVLTDPLTGVHERRVDVSVVESETGKTLTRYKLGWHLNVIDHSPTGFEWGYGGSGPAQLALAILCDLFKDEELAKSNYQTFKWDVIAKLPRHNPAGNTNMGIAWSLHERDINYSITFHKSIPRGKFLHQTFL